MFTQRWATSERKYGVAQLDGDVYRPDGSCADGESYADGERQVPGYPRGTPVQQGPAVRPHAAGRLHAHATRVDFPITRGNIIGTYISGGDIESSFGLSHQREGGW